MSLNDMTCDWGTSFKIMEITETSMKIMGVKSSENHIALFTNNPTPIKHFWKMFRDKYWWIIMSSSVSRN